MIVPAIVTAVGQVFILVLLIVILYFRQKTIDNLMEADRSHNRSIDLHWERMDALERRMDRRSEIHVGGDGFALDAEITTESDPRSPKPDDPNWHTYIDPVTNIGVRQPMDVKAPVTIDGVERGEMTLRQVMDIVGEKAVLDPIFARLRAQTHIHHPGTEN